MYNLLHDKKAYEECKIVVDKQKDLKVIGDSLLTVGQGRIINLENQVSTLDSVIIENDIQDKAFKEKSRKIKKNLIKVIITETGVIILETIIIILIII